jgi:hypothetical protein
MSVSQRDIVEVVFNLPQGGLTHPVVVLSKEDAIEQENGSFVGVMMTSKDYDDEFSYKITNDMLTKPFPAGVKHSEVRLHLISFFHESDVIKNSHYNTQLRVDSFKSLVKYISSLTFNVAIKPE